MASSRTLDPAIEILESHLFSLCDQKVAEVKTLFDLLASLNKNFIDHLENLSIDESEKTIGTKLLQLTQNYQEQKIKHFESEYQSMDLPFFNFNNEEIISLLDEYLKKQPKTKLLEQNKNRFHSESNDVWYFKVIKKIKLIFYRISIIPLVIVNFFKRLFKRKPVKIPYWRYRLPYRKLLEYNLKTRTLDELNDHLSSYSKGITHALKSALDKEQESNKVLLDICLDKQKQINISEISFNFKKEKRQLTVIKKEFRNNLEVLFEKSEDLFTELKPIIGTIEYPVVLLNYRNRNRHQQSVLNNLSKHNIGWGNTTFALCEDWKIDQEIYQLITEIQTDANAVKSVMNQNTISSIGSLDQTEIEIDNFKQRILERITKSKSDISNAIRDELNGLEKNITNTTIAPSIEILIDQNFPAELNKFELKINEFVAGISNIRWLTKLIDYDVPFKKSDLDSFSPNELINFKFLPDLHVGCSGLKSANVRRVESFKQEIGNIPEIIAFNLNSILDSIESGDGDTKDGEKLVLESIERSQNKLADIKASTLAYENEFNNELDTLVSNFNESAIVLTNNENAFNLRIAVTKAKALKKTEELKEAYWKKGKFLFFKLRHLSKQQLEKFNKIILPWKRRIGILESDTYVATELSDFLSEALQKINNLPIVYQQLYKIQPLKEMSLFTGREKELKQLLHAYKSWKEGKYAPTVIIGEKWSGHTTLINYFVKDHSDNKKVIYENRLTNIKSSEDFIEVWNAILPNQKFQTQEDVVQCLKTKHKNSIIIIENIQNYYLRTIKGFDCINLLVKLISETYREIFWLFSANIYAWDYLNNTIELSNYFGYHIKMEAFSDDKLRELIMKKNNISGYNIIFQPSSRNSQSKKFNSLNNSEQQQHLQDQFFNKLNGFAKGNISLALSYWLLSTNKITEDSIEINNFESPDLSFISTLKPAKIFLIYLLIMHDGLTLEHLSEIYKKPVEKLHLLVIMLLDDGILVERNDWFEVNPLIYRHSINMLKSKNLIY